MPRSSLPTQSAEPKPGPSVVFIGTRETLAALAGQVSRWTPAPLVGILVGGTAASAPTSMPTLSGADLPILGGMESLATILPRPRRAVVSLPASMPTLIDQVRRALAGLGIEERCVPPLAEAMAPNADTRSWWRPPARPIDPALLIGREPHSLDREAVGRVLRGKRVLITGAGGSIGSELARIAAGFEPEEIILMERAENALFEIDRQLGATGVARRAVLHDVVDAPGTRRLLGQLKPDVVFHAAAHKHVPLMEDHPGHAVTNNVFGTKSVADAAAAAGCERFVLISTDKAVHPTSVMGATKRIAEQYVRWLHRRVRNTARRAVPPGAVPPTTFSVVRFGNVLGSACSVLPIWAAQLADGGPITITDPRMTRFFMTIPEAATLVVQAAAMSTEAPIGTEAPLYVLDMGEPLRIVDLAERLVRLHQLEPVIERAGRRGVVGPGQVEIVFTGIRPGEKLDEELTYAAEPLRPTRHPGIRSFDAVGDPLPDVPLMVEALDAIRGEPEPETVLGVLGESVPDLGVAQFRRAG
jgi:FlaA1/EpsC-like NDP-sugar epimerase